MCQYVRLHNAWTLCVDPTAPAPSVLVSDAMHHRVVRVSGSARRRTGLSAGRSRYLVETGIVFLMMCTYIYIYRGVFNDVHPY